MQLRCRAALPYLHFSLCKRKTASSSCLLSPFSSASEIGQAFCFRDHVFGPVADESNPFSSALKSNYRTATAIAIVFRKHHHVWLHQNTNNHNTCCRLLLCLFLYLSSSPRVRAVTSLVSLIPHGASHSSESLLVPFRRLVTSLLSLFCFSSSLLPLSKPSLVDI